MTTLLLVVVHRQHFLSSLNHMILLFYFWILGGLNYRCFAQCNNQLLILIFWQKQPQKNPKVKKIIIATVIGTTVAMSVLWLEAAGYMLPGSIIWQYYSHIAKFFNTPTSYIHGATNNGNPTHTMHNTVLHYLVTMNTYYYYYYYMHWHDIVVSEYIHDIYMYHLLSQCRWTYNEYGVRESSYHEFFFCQHKHLPN